MNFRVVDGLMGIFDFGATSERLSVFGDARAKDRTMAAVAGGELLSARVILSSKSAGTVGALPCERRPIRHGVHIYFSEGRRRLGESLPARLLLPGGSRSSTDSINKEGTGCSYGSLLSPCSSAD